MPGSNSTKPEWVHNRGKEDIPEYNALFDRHCPLARTARFRRQCQRMQVWIAADIEEKKNTAKHPLLTRESVLASKKHDAIAEAIAASTGQTMSPSSLIGGNLTRYAHPSKQVWTICDETPTNRSRQEERGENLAQACMLLDDWQTIERRVSQVWAFFGVETAFAKKQSTLSEKEQREEAIRRLIKLRSDEGRYCSRNEVRKSATSSQKRRDSKERLPTANCR